MSWRWQRTDAIIPAPSAISSHGVVTLGTWESWLAPFLVYLDIYIDSARLDFILLGNPIFHFQHIPTMVLLDIPGQAHFAPHTSPIEKEPKIF